MAPLSLVLQRTAGGHLRGSYHFVHSRGHAASHTRSTTRLQQDHRVRASTVEDQQLMVSHEDRSSVLQANGNGIAGPALAGSEFDFLEQASMNSGLDKRSWWITLIIAVNASSLRLRNQIVCTSYIETFQVLPVLRSTLFVSLGVEVAVFCTSHRRRAFADTYSLFEVPGRPDIPNFVEQVGDLLCQYVASQGDQSQPVVRLLSPTELRHRFQEAGIPLELGQQQQPASMATLLAAVSTALRYSVRTGHPRFLNQLYARADPVSIAADWFTTAANTNVHTYEVAPVFTAVEMEMLSKLARCVGGPYAESSDGLFVPGGSISNIYGMHLARNKIDPDYRVRGAVGGPHLVAFTSEHAHYSYLKGSFLTGLGSQNLISVPCNDEGQMLPAALESAMVAAEQEGKVPFFVGATAGTTVLGAFDPFTEIADICQRHGAWFHVDGCWGAAALLSEKHRHLMRGSEQGDSLAWNPHKLMGLPLQCSAFLTRHRGMLQQSNATNASYLFQPDRLNADYDIGDKTIQCGRRGDAFKLWLAWKAYGDVGYAAKVEHSFELALHFEKRIQESGGAFALACPRSFVNVCFWWIPAALRPFDLATASQQQLDALSKVAPKIKGAMQQAGDTMINFQPLPGMPNFFRIVFPSALNVSKEDLDALLARIESYGSKLFTA